MAADHVLERHSLNSLLMADPGLTRRPNGEPYQVILLMNDDHQCIGIATDDDGIALGWPDPPYEGDDPQELLEDLLARAEPVPADVDVAAKAWWADWEKGHPGA